MYVDSIKFIILSVCLVFGYSSAHKDGYCLSDDENPYLKFSGITSYNYVKKNETIITDCRPVQIWMLIRHGTRYAGNSNLKLMKRSVQLKDDIIQNYELLNVSKSNRLCDKDYEALKIWKWKKSVDLTPSHLTDQGWIDMKNLGTRYKERYPNIFDGDCLNDYYFKHTNFQRTKYSCRAFQDGVFGTPTNINVQNISPKQSDKILEPYVTCKNWIKNWTMGNQNKETFRQSIQYMKLKSDVSERLGFPTDLDDTLIDSMYQNCRFDKTRKVNTVSSWCSAFSKDQLKLMEYGEDLVYFYVSGPGRESLNTKLGCVPLRNMRRSFQKTINKKSAKPKLIAMFGHDVVIDMVLTALNYTKDAQPLSETDFDKFLLNRKYRVSEHTPFGANFVAILQKCNQDDHRVQFYLNEQILELPGCPNGLCKWEVLEEIFSFTQDCKSNLC